MLLQLKEDIIYGPVNSRRLETSLGVNILPSVRKVCSFNCLYCQYGYERALSSDCRGQKGFPSKEDVFDAVREALIARAPYSWYITFSGNGEATMHPEFPDIVSGIVAIRDTCAPMARTAILSNSTGVTNPAVRDALQQLDMRIMKLDAGDPKMMHDFNQVHGSIRFDQIVEGLHTLEDVTIQALFAGGPAGNYREPHLTQWLRTIEYINPAVVQLYSLARDTPSRDITRLGHDQLDFIRDELASRGIDSFVF